jgi:hypothetical protein
MEGGSRGENTSSCWYRANGISMMNVMHTKCHKRWMRVRRNRPRKGLWKLSVGPLFDPQTSPRSCFVTVKEMRKRKPWSKKEEIEGRERIVRIVSTETETKREERRHSNTMEEIVAAHRNVNRPSNQEKGLNISVSHLMTGWHRGRS